MRQDERRPIVRVSRRWSARRPVLLAVILGALSATQCLRQDEVECEEAVARLSECCPRFDAKAISCRYQEGGCMARTLYPTLTPAESECILEKSCAELLSQKTCAAIARKSAVDVATYQGKDAGATSSGTNEEVVCH